MREATRRRDHVQRLRRERYLHDTDRRGDIGVSGQDQCPVKAILKGVGDQLSGHRDVTFFFFVAGPLRAAAPASATLLLEMPHETLNAKMLSILYNQGINPIFPDAVLEEAERVPVELDDKEILTRRDFRSTLTFTIDPFDARDFDDAISYHELENGHYELGVHIADVSHYVRPALAIGAPCPCSDYLK